ncbi:MAG: bifunctional pyr operon transcriptional regulator/uracil phosphoribosyltransferase PyrR [Actinobacteria bacterium]|nr:bifunctional pyr operon transcriptional regulator/uracil phosphoribosyltransferase PyrR [Actinomycetota bacterium]MCL6104129.1 bifunctional pyr operon transcriptional regulator/uracil phosphoribosyltransferase PyrR [Actinomycetota bacterium]
MSAEDTKRAITRIAHEILERNKGADNLVILGLQTGGVDLTHRLAQTLEELEQTPIQVGTLDVAFYRDDIGLRPMIPQAETYIPCNLDNKIVVLVDDVLFTGRTVRAALNAISDWGRASCIQLAVMIDRGHREVPIRPDYVGKNIPTRRDEVIDVTEEGVMIGEMVKIKRQ